ncbi:hypothetical protein [Saccharothrix obliqua]|uniref:hypothetical protein n=1 Tax=Saccharothrix obliqua TaxID=2861747 RepID=UPI001C5D10C6|nr:hypothetical protein [Saccharothrix obliqua]MBW4722292.1 hypothetical protein [Saccharothrix obliqua]
MQVQNELGLKQRWKPNPLGGVQRAGDDIDRLCVLYDQARQRLERLRLRWNRKHAPGAPQG